MDELGPEEMLVAHAEAAKKLMTAILAHGESEMLRDLHALLESAKAYTGTQAVALFTLQRRMETLTMALRLAELVWPSTDTAQEKKP